ncbi:MAG TPA: cupin domain-containing protein [Spirochaetales bacterium]|nr:cupin domain-containing protein [Spirochaetales bacterium]
MTNAPNHHEFGPLDMDVQEIVRRFGLEPLPVEGGYFRVTWVSPQLWQEQGHGASSRSHGASSRSCGEPSPRSCGSVIYYLLTDEPQGFSALHVLDTDEVYHFYAGDPVELYLFDALAPRSDASLHQMRRIELGTDFAAGQVPQAVVPGNTVQGSRLIGNGKWALLGTSMAPGYSDDHFKIIYRKELLALYPECRPIVEALTRQ